MSAHGGARVTVIGLGGRCQRAWAQALGVPEAAGPEAAGDGAGVLLAFYQPPWEAFLEASAVRRSVNGTDAREWLDGWLAFHERLLAACEAHAGPMLLVNAARMRHRSAELLNLLRAQGVAIPGNAGAEQLEPWPVAADHAVVLARQLQELAPETWDVYEALESMAELLGREPEFRSLESEPDCTLNGLLYLASEAIAARVHDSAVGPRTEAMRQRAETIARLEAELAAARETAVSEETLAEMRLEAELQTNMLMQMQEELHHQVSSNHALRGELARCADASDQAVALIAKLGATKA